MMKKKPQTEHELFKDIDQVAGLHTSDKAPVGRPLFLTEDPRDGPLESDGAGDKAQEQVVYEEDMGRSLMDSFKQKCRRVLGGGASSLQPEWEVPGDQTSHEYELMSRGNDQVDLITAYKSLKHSMHKNLKGLGRGRDLCTGKGFLRPTIISQQAERLTAGLPPHSMNQLDMQRSQHLWKPEKSIPDMSYNDGRRLVTRATSRAPPGTAHGSVKVGRLHGMTLHDYAGGTQWCKNGFEPSQSKGSAFSGTRSNAQKIRSTTAPCWRKPRYQRVDEKVQKLLED